MATLEAVVTELKELNQMTDLNTEANLEISFIMGKLLSSMENLNKTYDAWFDYTRKQDLLQSREDAFDPQPESKPQTKQPIAEPKPEKIETPDSLLGWVGGLLGLAGSLIIGFVEGFYSQVKALSKLVKTNVFKSFGGISEGISRIFATIKSYIGMVANTISSLVKGGVKIIRSYVGMISQSVQAVLGIGDDIAKATKGIRTAFASIKTGGGFIKPIMDTVKSVMDFMKGLSGVFRAVGNVLGKLVLPITIIMGIFDGITGFIDGFANESGNLLQKVLSGLYGAVEEIIANLIFLPIDLLKGAVSWILDAIGLDFVSDMLDSFSFEDIFRGLFGAITDAIVHPVETLKKLWSSITDWVSEKVKMLNPLNWFGGDEEESPETTTESFSTTTESFSGTISGATPEQAAAFAAAGMGPVGTTPDDSLRTGNVERPTPLRGRVIGDDQPVKLSPRAQKSLAEFKGTSITASSSSLLDDGEYDAIQRVDSWNRPPAVDSPVAEAMSIDYTDELQQVKEILSDLFTPVLNAFNSVKEFITNLIPIGKIQEALTNLFAEIGIPRVEFTIPFIDKTVGFGPFYPFRPGEGTTQIASQTSVETVSSEGDDGSSDYKKTFKDNASGIEDDSVFSYAKESVDQQVVNELGQKENINTSTGVSASFDDMTGKGRVVFDEYKTIDNLTTGSFEETQNVIKEYEVGPIAMGKVRRMIDAGASPDQVREFLELNERSVSEKISSFFSNQVDNASSFLGSFFGGEQGVEADIPNKEVTDEALSLLSSISLAKGNDIDELTGERSEAVLDGPLLEQDESAAEYVREMENKVVKMLGAKDYEQAKNILKTAADKHNLNLSTEGADEFDFDSPVISGSQERVTLSENMQRETTKMQDGKAEEAKATSVVAPIVNANNNSTSVNNQTINAGPMPSAVDKSDRTDRRAAFRGRAI